MCHHLCRQNDGGYVFKLADVKSGSLSRGVGSKANLVNNDDNENQHATRYELSSPPLVPPKPEETPL